MTGMVVLVAAIVLANNLLAVIAVGIALVGLIRLGRDWLRERENSESDADADWQSDRREDKAEAAPPADGLKPELFTPDVSYEEAVQGVDDDEELDLEGNG